MIQDYIVIHIFHGSLRKWSSRNQPKELGGKLGGHVAIEVQHNIYGFYYKNINKIHIFPNKKNKNCEFQKQSLEEWAKIVSTKKETTFKIPVTEDEVQYLLDYYHKNIASPSCDYSFFGERCASNCYHLLKEIGKIDGGSYFLNAFWPGQLIRKLTRESKKRAYEINIKPGSSDRIWQ